MIIEQHCSCKIGRDFDRLELERRGISSLKASDMVWQALHATTLDFCQHSIRWLSIDASAIEPVPLTKPGSLLYTCQHVWLFEA